MFRIFWKSIFVSFSLIFLIVNISFFFNLVNYSSVASVFVADDLSNKYFGVSSFVEFLSDFDTSDNDFLTRTKDACNQFLLLGNKLLFGNWITMFSDGLQWYDVLGAIFLLVESIFSIFVYVFYVIIYVIYELCVIGFILAKIFMILGGFYNKVVPTTSLNVLINFV